MALPMCAQQASPAAKPEAQTPATTSGAASAGAQADHPSHPPHKVPKTAEEARAEMRRVEAEHPGDSEELAKDMASAALLEAAYEKATEQTLAEAQRAVAMAEKVKGKESSLYGYTLAVEARVLLEMDRPDLARPMAEQAVVNGQTANAPVDEYANEIAALSAICYGQRDLDCAVRAGQLQVDLARKTPERGATFLASALNSLAVAHYRKSDYENMGKAVMELLDLESKQTVFSNPLWETTENTASLYFTGKGQYDKAREHLLRAIEIDKLQKGPDDPELAVMIGNLAFAEMCLGNYAEGYKQYIRAHDLYVRRFGPAHSRTSEIDYRYAETLHFLGRDKEAMEWALKAHRHKREYVTLVIRLMPERQALALSDQDMPSLGAAVTIAFRHPEFGMADVYQELVRSRALVAEEMAQRAAGLNRKHDPATEELEKELDEDRRAVMSLEGAGNQTPEALEQATAKMEKAERELAERSAQFRTDERGRTSALADLRANLPRDAVLVSYVRFEQVPSPPLNFDARSKYTYAAFVMHPDGRPVKAFELARATEIATLVERMRASAEAEAHSGGMNATRNEREYREAGQALRKLIWDPVAGEIGNAKHVFVVPDDVLNLVPFGSLPSGAGYMVEHGPVIHVLTSERDLLPAPGEKKAGLLAVGSPAFELAELKGPSDGLRGGSINCDAFTKIQFPALPDSLGEVKDVSAAWERWNGEERAQLLTGEEATRAHFVEDAPNSRVLHIATHAFVLDQACGKGNPLLHSGLVFAGANKSREGSVLTAQQIASLDLRGVDWAVLSACNSGYGELKDGEGVLGLERSFRVAGARSVVMALWPVDDSAARGFMRTLYAERYGRHESTADAMWNASRKVLERRRAAGKSTHPWYWASFVAAGGWE
jgi:CHAT domain-containing protein